MTTVHKYVMIFPPAECDILTYVIGNDQSPLWKWLYIVIWTQQNLLSKHRILTYIVLFVCEELHKWILEFTQWSIKILKWSKLPSVFRCCNLQTLQACSIMKRQTFRGHLMEVEKATYYSFLKPQIFLGLTSIILFLNLFWYI